MGIKNIGSFFQVTLRKYGNKTAIKTNEREINYKELLENANELANFLREKNLQPNEKVAMLLPNIIEYAVIDLAIMFARGTRVALNTMLSEQEIYYMLKDSESKFVFVDKQFINIVLNIFPKLPKLEYVIVLNSKEGTLPASFIRWEDCKYSGKNVHEEKYNELDEAFIAYTGGTTGYPKGAVYNHKKMYTILLAHIIEIGIQKEERILLTTPLPHSAGMIMLTGLLRGATIYLEKKFQPERTIKILEEEHITLTFMMPTMIYRILDRLSESKTDQLPALRTILYGAAPMSVEKLKKAIDIFGPVFTQLYGQTESYNFITRLTKEDHLFGLKNKTLLASCGQSALLSKVKIVDEDMKELDVNEVGEVVVKSPYNMVGYYNNEKKTRETLINGWLYTGDIGYKDKNGFLFLLDRKNDMIISGGLNIYSTEVEQVLLKHPKIAQVAVFGKPDEDWGEAVVAVIVPVRDKKLDIEEIRKYCKQNMTNYKVPKFIEISKELPLTPYGKIDKKLLKKLYN